MSNLLNDVCEQPSGANWRDAEANLFRLLELLRSGRFGGLELAGAAFESARRFGYLCDLALELDPVDRVGLQRLSAEAWAAVEGWTGDWIPAVPISLGTRWWQRRTGAYSNRWGIGPGLYLDRFHSEIGAITFEDRLNGR
ncbi:hypothetical protein [Roseomonas genomospecies 6]|nr:hypothetical protein [Roseomonas genomospecies 6]